MKLSDLKQLYYKPLQQWYKEFLFKQVLSKVAVETAYSDTFYLRRKGSRNLFWDVVESDDIVTNRIHALLQSRRIILFHLLLHKESELG